MCNGIHPVIEEGIKSSFQKDDIFNNEDKCHLILWDDSPFTYCGLDATKLELVPRGSEPTTCLECLAREGSYA
jgi:hypothetical protein